MIWSQYMPARSHPIHVCIRIYTTPWWVYIDILGMYILYIYKYYIHMCVWSNGIHIILPKHLGKSRLGWFRRCTSASDFVLSVGRNHIGSSQFGSIIAQTADGCEILHQLVDDNVTLYPLSYNASLLPITNWCRIPKPSTVAPEIPGRILIPYSVCTICAVKFPSQLCGMFCSYLGK